LKKDILNLVSVSGGKDSTATLLLAIERGAANIQGVFADTGNEHPATIEYVDYLRDKTGIDIQTVTGNFAERVNAKRQKMIDNEWAWVKKWPEEARLRAIDLLKPTGNPFLDLCILKARFPSRMAQFCTQELKVNPIINDVILPASKQYNWIISHQGVRRDESLKRRNTLIWEQEFGNIWNYRPIADWTAQDCIDMHKRHGLKPNPLYSQGMKRVGCMPCINCGKSELREIAARFPNEIARIAEWERLVSKISKRESATFFGVTDEKNENISPETHGIHTFVKWSKTSHGGKQFQMFQETPQCSSSYGLCE